MSGILSAISGQFSKALILGAFLPTAVFVILSLVFLAPLLPTEWPVLALLIALDPQWKVIVLTVVTIVLSGVLYNVNVPIIRFYEGYPWKNSSVGKWQTRRQAAHFTSVSSRWVVGGGRGARADATAPPRPPFLHSNARERASWAVLTTTTYLLWRRRRPPPHNNQPPAAALPPLRQARARTTNLLLPPYDPTTPLCDSTQMFGDKKQTIAARTTKTALLDVSLLPSK